MTTTHTHPAAGYLAHEGEPVWFGTTLFEFLVTSDSTDGQIAVFRYTAPGGFAPPRHIHTREDEIFHVLEGEVAFEVDGRRQLAGPGTTVWMPRGVPHGFRIESPVARIIGIITPGEYEHLFRDLGVPAPARTLPGPDAPALDIGALAAAMNARGTEVIGPPMPPS